MLNHRYYPYQKPTSQYWVLEARTGNCLPQSLPKYKDLKVSTAQFYPLAKLPQKTRLVNYINTDLFVFS